MDRLEITFADGTRLSCSGMQIDTNGGSLRANADGSFVEVRDTVKFEIAEGTIYVLNGGLYEPSPLPLEPGLYLINEDGLWKHV